MKYKPMNRVGLSRRTLLGTGLASGALLTAAPLYARVQAQIPQRPASRVIVDNDFAGDPDGLVALAHQSLAPRTRVVLVTSSALNERFMAPGAVRGQTARQGRDVAVDLIARLGPAVRPSIVAGAEAALAGDRQPSAAARAIVAEAMRDDPLPLIFTCGGPLTNLAEALLLEPAIATRMRLIWIGGGRYPEGGWEYNLAMDPEAVSTVIERSTLPVWQVPQPAYRQMAISVAEMAADLRPISPFTHWLYDRFTNPPTFFDVGGAWPMGDSPLVLLSAITAESSRASDLPARRIADDGTYGAEISGRSVRVFDTVDARLTWADFLARLRLHAAGMPG